MSVLDEEKMKEIKEVVYAYFADECDMEIEDMTDQTDIIEDLEGDSLMLLSLLEIFRKKYGLTIELKTLGKHLMKRPANKIGQVIELTAEIVKHGNNIINLEF
ncbi:MAG: acyl carrier protein [Proteobacteria bacterium]|nr:acyl carrier protein [Pseudomonadota bacterium]